MAGLRDPTSELEQRVLARWRGRDVAGEARRRREGAPVRAVWERPAGACTSPAAELGSRILADVFARYATMRGWQVDRRGVRDCHDPAVELAVERGLATTSAAHVRRHGMADLTARCRAAALESAAALDALSARLGLHGAGDELTRTLAPGYVESVWWAVKEVANQGRLHEQLEVLAYCPRCETGLSADESALADVTERSAIVRFAVARDGGPLQAGDELLVATREPWKLVGNAAVAVDPELTYVRAKTGTLDAPVVVAEALAEQVLGAPVRVLERFRGAAIDGVRYEPPLQYLPASRLGERGHTVLLAGFVTATEGTGLLAVAPAFGEDDLRLGRRYGLAVVNPVGTGGAFDERAGRYAGRGVRDADAALVDDLRARGRVLSAESRTVAAAACTTCATALLPYAKAAWHVAAPGLRGDVDVLLSYERCWGTPLPVWRCEHGHVTVVGSFDELEQRSGSRLADPHRPFADDVALRCDCGAPAARVPDLVAPWFEAAAMPFAASHEPFAGELTLDELYPADVGCVPPSRPRTWSSSLRRMSMLLRGDAEACERMVAPRSGATAGASGQPEGADAQRWAAVTGERGGAEIFARLLSACDLAPPAAPEPPEAARIDLDRFIRSRLSATIVHVGERLDAFNAHAGAATIATFADDLCSWYVPASRQRLLDGDAAALTTLRDCLATLAQLLAPFAPFHADAIYDRLGGAEPSVHLSDWPAAGARDLALEAAIGLARGA
jgi:isoleucyl-tRNA synthetase